MSNPFTLARKYLSAEASNRTDRADGPIQAIKAGFLCNTHREEPVAESQKNGPETFNLDAELDGPIQAVQIYSKVLGADIWLVFDTNFLPHDGLAIFYPDEMTKMGTKTTEDLLAIHKAKLVFPGCRIIQ